MCHILQTAELFLFFFFMNTKKCQGTQSLGLLNSTAGEKNQSIGAWPYFFTHKLP